MRAGVADHVQPVRAVDRHGLDDVTLGDLGGQVDQLSVDPGGHHSAVSIEQRERGSAGLDRPRLGLGLQG